MLKVGLHGKCVLVGDFNWSYEGVQGWFGYGQKSAHGKRVFGFVVVLNSKLQIDGVKICGEAGNI